MTDRLALVFGGGGAKGAFGAGVLWGLLKQHPTLRWHVVSGTSTGALITPFAVLAAGQAGPPNDRAAMRDLRRLYVEARNDTIINSNFEWHELPRALIDLPTGLNNAGPLREQIERDIPPPRLQKILASDVVGLVNSVDLQTGELQLWTQRRHRPEIKEWFAKT